MNNEPDSIQSSGGKARAESLTDQQRKEIASKAAQARWAKPKATHAGELHIGDITIPCAVLEDGTRVLTQQGFYMAIGRSGKPAKGWGSSVEKVAPFLALDNLTPFVDSELADSSKPIEFIPPKGSKAFGYRAELLPRVCEVYLQAREAGKLLESQEKFARACEIIVRGLARVGIVALIDEATGYQEVRNKEALQALLEAFMRKEFAAWAKRFPDEFYKEIFRLWGWEWKSVSVRRPIFVGKLTNNIVYERLAPGLLDELQNRNPKDEKGRRAQKNHQWLSDDLGHPALSQHLHAVIGLMRASANKKQFLEMLDRAFPKKGNVLQMELISDE